MLQSFTIEVDGQLVGAAVRLDSGYRFIAVDFRLYELDGTTWRSLSDVRRLARQLYLTGHFADAHGSNVPVVMERNASLRSDR